MATKKPTKKAVNKQTKKVQSHKVVLSEDGYRLRKLEKRQQVKKDKLAERKKVLPSAWRIMQASLRQLYDNKKIFGGILLIYGILYMVFVKGVGDTFQLANLRDSLQSTFGEEITGISSGIALYGALLGSAGTSATEVSGVYQSVLLIISSLALIWALRLTYLKTVSLRVRDSFYKGMTPLVPFVLVSLVIIVQMLPALIVSSLFGVVQANDVVAGAFQEIVAAIILLLGVLWSLYMLSSSIFALYIVTLEGTAPRAALKAARKLTRFRRDLLLRKILFLPLALLIVSALMLVPLILFMPVAAEAVFLVFSILILGIVHSYFYTLYRSLL